MPDTRTRTVIPLDAAKDPDFCLGQRDMSGGPLTAPHAFRFLRTVRDSGRDGDNMGQWSYWRIDTFYCAACLAYREVCYSDVAKEAPDWWQSGSEPPPPRRAQYEAAKPT